MGKRKTKTTTVPEEPKLKLELVTARNLHKHGYVVVWGPKAGVRVVEFGLGALRRFHVQTYCRRVAGAATSRDEHIPPPMHEVPPKLGRWYHFRRTGDPKKAEAWALYLAGLGGVSWEHLPGLD